jgi:hypothetical protein
LEKERTNFGSAAHADWMRRASRMLDKDGRVGRGVGRSFPGWFRFTFGGAEGGGERVSSGRLRRQRHGSQNTGMAAGSVPVILDDAGLGVGHQGSDPPAMTWYADVAIVNFAYTGNRLG